MKGISLSILIILTLLTEANAQVEGVSFVTSIYSNHQNCFFNQHTKIDRITIGYKEKRVDWVNVYYKKKINLQTVDERYDFVFDGDVYLFKKRHPKFDLPAPVELTVYSIGGVWKDLGHKNSYYDVYTTLKRDSIKNEFYFYLFDESKSLNKHIRSSPSSSRKPNFRGDVAKLTIKLEQAFKTWKPIKVPDTIIMMKGMVSADSKLGRLELIEGKNSEYASKVMAVLQSELQQPKSWYPKIYKELPADGFVRISVIIRKDETMKVSIY